MTRESTVLNDSFRHVKVMDRWKAISMYNVFSIDRVLSFIISHGNLSLTFQSGHSRQWPEWLRKSGNNVALNIGTFFPSHQTTFGNHGKEEL